MTRVLVVDDERDMVEYLTEELQDAGWQTGKAYDGVEAVLKVIAGGWDAVLMDIRMPNLDGINALRIIRSFDPNLPVVMLTGQAGRGDMVTANRLGAKSCLVKPTSYDSLVKTLSIAMKIPVI